MLVLLCLSCQNKDEGKLPDLDGNWKTDKDTPPQNLKGTNWKLVGALDTQENIFKELEPKDCEECYTLTFETNNIASGYSVSLIVYVDLSDFNKYEIEDISEPSDGDIFRQIIVGITSYSVTSGELKIFSDIHKTCLIFKPIEP